MNAPEPKPGTLDSALLVLGGVVVLVAAWRLGGWIIDLPALRSPLATLGFIVVCLVAAVLFFLDGLRRRRKRRLP